MSPVPSFARFEAAAVRVRLPDPPALNRAKLIAAFDIWAADRRGPSVVQRLVASLTFDGFAGPAVAGARGGATGTDRQLLFGTDLADVAFHVLPGNAGTMVLDGQVLLLDDEADADADVALLAIDGGDAAAIVATDAEGQFRFEGVAAGSYLLRIDLASVQLDVGPFEVTTP